MRHVLRVLIGLLCFSAAATFAQHPPTPAEALARVLQQTPAQPSWFAPVFLAQIPVAQIDAVVKQYREVLGEFRRADTAPDGYTLVMERGTAPARIHLDDQGRIDTLWFGIPQTTQPATLEDIVKELAALPGRVSAVVLEDGKAIAALHPDDPLAVGSSFKLAILAAAQQQAASGKHSLSETFLIKKEWKSLPSGVLQTWPDGTPLTLATLENQMISISDNTAADALLSIVGRDQAEKYARRNTPFLSTREAFALKGKSNAALLDRYRKADVAGRRSMLADIDTLPLPPVTDFLDQPVATDVEWFFTAAELCSLVEKSADAPAFEINPGLADFSQLKRVAFKGGSEPGVLNFTTDLIARNGKHYCVATTWNNASALDQNRLSGIYLKFLGVLVSRSKL